MGRVTNEKKGLNYVCSECGSLVAMIWIGWSGTDKKGSPVWICKDCSRVLRTSCKKERRIHA